MFPQFLNVLQWPCITFAIEKKIVLLGFTSSLPEAWKPKVDCPEKMLPENKGEPRAAGRLRRVSLCLSPMLAFFSVVVAPCFICSQKVRSFPHFYLPLLGVTEQSVPTILNVLCVRGLWVSKVINKHSLLF